MDATGTAGHAEAVLGWWLTGTAGVVVVIICVAILLGISRHRHEENTPSATSTSGRHGAGGDTSRREIASGLNWIFIGLGITVVVLIISFAATMLTLNATSRVPGNAPLTMDVIGHQWWWEVRYSDPARPYFTFTTANEVHLPIGVPIRVRLRSDDVIHSFWLPQISGKTDVVPGQMNETWLEAQKPGQSIGMCGEYCGLGHAVMALAVTSESPAEFTKWADERLTDAAPPTTAEATVGQVVFARTCAACHTVSGTRSMGRAGPDLSHFASRPTIGAGALSNTAPNLARWIKDAPAVKEGARMPAIPLDPVELRAVVAYVQTLH